MSCADLNMTSDHENDTNLMGIKEHLMPLYKQSRTELIKAEEIHLKWLKGTIFLNRLLLSKSIEQFAAIKINEEHILIDKSGKPCVHKEGESCECV